MITEPRLHETLATPSDRDERTRRGWAGAVGIDPPKTGALSVYTGCLLTFVRIRDDGYMSAWIISIVTWPIIIVVVVIVNNCPGTKCKAVAAASLTRHRSLSVDFHGVERIRYYVYRWYNTVCSLLRSFEHGPSSFSRDLSSTARLTAITVIIDRMHFRMRHFYGRRSRLKALIGNFSRNCYTRYVRIFCIYKYMSFFKF